MKTKPFVRILIERYLWFALFIVILAIVFSTLIFRIFYDRYIYEPVIETSVSSVLSYLFQWANTLQTYDIGFQKSLRELLEKAYVEFENNPAISDMEIDRFLAGYFSFYAVEGMKSVNWYLVNSEGVIYRTNYATDMGFSIKKAVPNYWLKKINVLKDRQELIETLAFEYNTVSPRTYAYKRLPDGDIFEIGILLDEGLIDQLKKQFPGGSKQFRYFKSIGAYNYEFIPFGGSDPLSTAERQIFLDLRGEESYRIVQSGRGVRIIYKNWFQSADIEANDPPMMTRLRIILDFTGLENFRQLIIVFFNVIIIVTILLIIWSNIHTVKRNFGRLWEIIGRMERFRHNPSAFVPQKTSVPDKSIEMEELEEIFNRMAQTISNYVNLQDSTNKDLKDTLEIQGKREQWLQLMSVTDELTGLYNRREFILRLSLIIQESQMKRKIFSVAFIDVDELKQINDHFGHPVGDEVLKWIASEAKRLFRASDIVARIGGDEFAVIFPDIGSYRAESVLRRVHECVIINEKLNEAGLYPTFSYGIAKFDFHNPLSAEALIAAADKAMYESKKKKAEH
jgi:diguanylate cyclase (GGDEF)-like protein